MQKFLHLPWTLLVLYSGDNHMLSGFYYTVSNCKKKNYPKVKQKQHKKRKKSDSAMFAISERVNRYHL